MAKRYGRRRVDGVYEYSNSMEELEASAMREDEESLRRTFAFIGVLLGAAVTYGLVSHYVPDWPKVIRFASVVAGGCLSAIIFARLAVLLTRLFAIALAVSVLGGLGYLLWWML